MEAAIRAVRFFLAHTPGLVRYGSRPGRDLAGDAALEAVLAAHLRPFEAALAYPPHQVLLGHCHPTALRSLPRPWWAATAPAPRQGPHGELMPEAEFYGLLKLADAFDLVQLDPAFVAEVRPRLAAHPLLDAADLQRLQGAGGPPPPGALPLLRRDGQAVGYVRAGHPEDEALSAAVVLENLACKATAAMALRGLLAQEGLAPASVEHVLNSGEEAVGDRYQRGGGNLAKAVAEWCRCQQATGVDIKGFCCGPLHALVVAAALVRAGVFRQVAVVAGGALAKLGMKYRGHLQRGAPILEDVLAGVAVLVGADDGRAPRLRLDALGRHPVGAGAAQQAIFEHLVCQPLARLGLRLTDVDVYATELHDPEVTEAAGSGNVPLLNYRLIAALAARRGDIAPQEIPQFVARHGLPGFAPTQGHFASAVPFLGHALDGLRDGRLRRVLFLAKGSLFLGRMTPLADGISFLLERPA